MKLSTVEQLLTDFYGRPRPNSRESALATLIATILSQNTSDTNSGRAYKSLRNKFRDWSAAAAARLTAIEKTIAPGGLAKTKAAYIHAALQKVKQDFGEYSLESLKNWPVDKSLEYLTSFQGVGHKTAACVLLFALHKKIMPVDTHIHRVSNRIGLVDNINDREKTFEYYHCHKDINDYYSLHINLVRHGRGTCKASRPNCENCILREICRFAGGK